MYPSRERVEADLRGVLQGDVRCDELFVQMYASDASIYEIRPLGVVRPVSTRDVVACVQYAAENKIPIHARGAGTGIAGESLGAGLVIDFSHSMRRIISNSGNRVRVQPGVGLAQLDRQLSAQGRCFGPDPANRSVTTMGSVIAIDAGGSHWSLHGSARDHIESLQVVLASGDVVELSKHDIDAAAQSGTLAGKLATAAARLIRDNSRLIHDGKPKTLVNRSGYRLDDVITGNQIDMARLLVGSEGTLGLITEATVRTSFFPNHTGVAMLFFDRLENAAHAALEVQKLNVSACDLLDRRLLRLACESDARYQALLPGTTEALLLVEKVGASATEVREALQHLVYIIRRRKKLAFDARVAVERDDVDLFWELPHRVVPTLYRLKGSTRPLPFVEDVVIPPLELPSFLTKLQNVLKKHQVTASLFAHAGHGQLHLRPFLDLANRDQVRRMEHLARDLYAEVLAVGGTISGEHADGLSRTWFLREQFGPLYEVFVELKRLFDPDHILNPGKIIDTMAQPISDNLRPMAAVRSAEETFDSTEPDAVTEAGDVDATPRLVQVELNWSDQDLTQVARSCNGCGSCRTTSSFERMCPMFRLAPNEEASPRAKANLMRAILTGRLDANHLSSDALKSIADLCFNCHQCRLECPAEVDIPKLMIECKAHYVASNGLRMTDWILGRIDKVASWVSVIAPLINWALQNPQIRWFLQRTVGIAQQRKMPRFSQRNFMRRAGRKRLTRPVRRSGRKILYFVDSYANWFDTQLAEAVVSVLEHNGVSVYVHPRQRSSGMTLISLGAIERAKRMAQQNVLLLADAVRQGYHIVSSEPSATLCLTREYRHLLDDEDATLVAENSSDVCAYLWKMHQMGELELDLQPLNLTVGYHQPCHLRALQVGSPGENLLRLIPGLTVRSIECGCSGMAGTFGMRRENYRTSLRIGWDLISALRSPSLNVGTTECSACKIQMEQGTTKPTIHPIKILAFAYRLMPEIALLFTKSGEELVVT
jgi:FAD/FMN-containing dehydrogenase/Fe-S oxidoreductase